MKKFSRVIDSLGGGIGKRREQELLANDLLEHGLSHKISGYNASTGLGKTMAYAIAALQSNMPVLIAVPNHNLAKQVISTIDRINAGGYLKHKTVSHRKGRQEYLSPTKVAFHYEHSDDKDNAYWEALVQASTSQDSSNLISNFIAEYDSLPTGMSLSSVTCDKEHSDSALLLLDRESEVETDILVVTHIGIITPFGFLSIPEKHRNGLLIIDEADSIISTAESIFSKRISISTITGLSERIKGKVLKDSLSKLDSITEGFDDGMYFFNQAPQLIPVIEKLEAALYRYSDEEAQALASRMTDFTDLTFVNAALVKEKGKLRILQLAKFGAYVMRYRLESFKHTWLVSATLDVTCDKANSMNWLTRMYGLKTDEVGFYRDYEVVKYGNISLKLAEKNWPKPVKFDETVVSAEFCKANAAFIKTSLPHAHTLVCVSSYQEARALGAELEGINIHALIDRPGTPISKIIETFQEQDSPSILVTPRANTGVDIRKATGGQLITHLIITKLPFMPPPDKQELAYLAKNSSITPEQSERFAYADGLQKSVRKAIQTFGRAIRSKSDSCVISILDPRFPRFENSSGHSLFKQVIPGRFIKQYLNASEITLSELSQGTTPSTMKAGGPGKQKRKMFL
jgi:Rad3-related DNA helicase